MTHPIACIPKLVHHDLQAEKKTRKMDEKKDEQNVEILIYIMYLMESTWFNSMSPDEDELVNLSTG